MPATFLELHKVETRIVRALEILDAEDRAKVIERVLVLYPKVTP